MMPHRSVLLTGVVVLIVFSSIHAISASEWKVLGESDFAAVNCDPETFQFGKEPGSLHCTGVPHGGLKSRQVLTNFELEFEWRHNRFAGNSGVFLWSPSSVLESLPRNKLPEGIEVQILDPGFETNWIKNNGKPSDWFTSHGDIFSVGGSTMKASNPEVTYTEDGSTWTVRKPDAQRTFPTKRLTKPAGEWNHYRIVARDGEVVLWVNGEQVSRATDCKPQVGHLVLESEGAPVDFRGMRLRQLD